MLQYEQKGREITYYHSRVALIIEGGGMRATYTAGIAAALIEKKIRFSFLAGISAGSTILANILVEDIERLRRSFVELSDHNSFAAWRSFFHGNGYFNVHNIYEESCEPDALLAFDYEYYQKNTTPFAIGAFARDLGNMHWFTRKDIHSTKDLARICRASSSLPILMPPTWFNRQCYVDGGLKESIPISIAIEHGCEYFLILRSQPANFRKKIPKKTPISAKLLHRYPYLSEAISTRPKRYNQEVERLQNLEYLGKALNIYPKKMSLSRTTLQREQLEQAFEDGFRQGRYDMPIYMSFLEKVDTL